MIQDSLKNRKHVVDYSTTIIPTREEINNILATAYPLVTSKQKGYPYQVHILGPNKARSKELWELCEGNKIDTDIGALGEAGSRYRSNPGLYHMYSSPWTLIYGPRVAPANAFYRQAFDNTNSLWELEDKDFVNTRNRESCAIEIGMLAKAITGATLDQGWDTSYNVCFPRQFKKWVNFPHLEFTPALIQTIGKGVKYKWEDMGPENSKLDIDAPFDDIFKYIDKEDYN